MEIAASFKAANIHSLAAIRPCGGVGGGDKAMCDQSPAKDFKKKEYRIYK